MKTFIFLLLILPFVAHAGDPVTVSPEKPVLNEKVTIFYNPAEDRAVLRQTENIDLYMLYWYEKGDPVFHLVPMEAIDTKWKASFILDDESLRAVQFKFKSGKLSDNNNELFLDFPVHDTDGNILPGSHYALGRSWMPMLPMHGLEMLREINLPKAENHFAQEFKHNPQHKEAAINYIRAMSWQLRDADDPDELKERGLNAAQKIHKLHSDDPDVLASLVSAYSGFGDIERGTELHNYIKENYPDHSFVVNIKAGEIFQARDDKEKSVELARAFLKEYPGAERVEQIVSAVYLPNLVALGNIDEAITWIQEYEDATPAMYWHLANTMLRDEVDPQKIVPVAHKALTLVEKHPPVEKPSYATPGDWETYKQSFIGIEIGLPAGYFYHTYATALFRNNEIDSALEPIQKAYEITEGRNARINTRYVEILHAAGKYEHALEAGRRTIIDNQAEEELIKQLEKTFASLHDTNEGFMEFIDDARYETALSLREKFAERMIEREAPDFTLDQLDGEPVSLSELEGKVVVLDFWATWCGPCISAFPHFQRVVEHFEDNPDVVFLAINTWEGDYDEERIEKVRNFIEENEYTFTVLFDEDTVVSEYEVRGIPTRFTLDRDGVIRFEDRGFSGPGMYHDMIVQIEMLLEGYEPLTEL